MDFNIKTTNLLQFINKCKINHLNTIKQCILYLNNIYNFKLKDNNIKCIEKIYTKNQCTNIIVYFR